MFDMVGAAFSYGRELIICLFLRESSKVKESSLHEIWIADTAFSLSGAELHQGDCFPHHQSAGMLLNTLDSKCVALLSVAVSVTLHNWFPYPTHHSCQ